MTVHQIAGESAQLSLAAPVRSRAPGCTVPLTAMQLRNWTACARHGRHSSRRVCASAVRILGKLDCTLLQRCIETVVRRHEALRTRIITVDGAPRQHIDAVCEYRLETIALPEFSSVDTEREVMRLAQVFLHEEIDLAVGPLFEARLWKLSGQEHVLILALDHMVGDGISYGILNREVWTLFRRGAQPPASALPPVPVQFADYAIWQHLTRDHWTRTNRQYWTERLAGAPRLQLPVDAGSCAQLAQSSVVAQHIPFGQALSAALRAVARREGTLLSLLILSIYVIVISRWSRQNDVVISYVSHGRDRRPELANTIGFIASLLFLRITTTATDSFRTLIHRVALEVSTALEHADFDRVPDFIPECGSEATFNWQSTHSARGPLDHHFVPEISSQLDFAPSWASARNEPCHTTDNALSIRPFPAYCSDGAVKFAPIFYDTTSGIHLVVMYSPHLLSASALARFRCSLLSIAEYITENPSSRITEMPWTVPDIDGS